MLKKRRKVNVYCRSYVLTLDS